MKHLVNGESQLLWFEEVNKSCSRGSGGSWHCGGQGTGLWIIMHPCEPCTMSTETWGHHRDNWSGSAQREIHKRLSPSHNPADSDRDSWAAPCCRTLITDASLSDVCGSLPADAQEEEWSPREWLRIASPVESVGCCKVPVYRVEVI